MKFGNGRICRKSKGAEANEDEIVNAYETGRGSRRRVAGAQRSIKQIACGGQTR